MVLEHTVSGNRKLTWFAKFAIFVLTASAAGLCQAARPSSEIVRIAQGELQGARQGDVDVFKGVPYAAPPIGELRWRPPAPALVWRGVRPALEYGNLCTQTAEIGQLNAPVIGSEDCLTLNIWAPQSHRSPLAVVMWIHGGFSNWGGSSAIVRGVRLYDGLYMAEHASVIVVTVNYRLGPLGFLAHPALSAETSYHGSGNYGYMDLIAALNWIKGNIAVFGGDPTNVTVFGESGGATAVGALMCSPQARGLFQHAILMSGANVKRPLHVAESYGLQLGQAIGCTGLRAASCMRSKPGAMLITALPRALSNGGSYYRYDVDGYVLTEPTLETFVAGREMSVPLITGVTSEEAANLLQYYSATGENITTMQDRPKAAQTLLQHQLQTDAPSAQRLYKRCSNRYRNSNDAAIGCVTQAVLCANQHFAYVAAKRARVYRYIYSHTFHSGPLNKLGAGHGVELYLLFHNFPPVPKYPAPDEAELALSDTLIAYFTQFAKTGDPNHANQPSPWPNLKSVDSRIPYLQLSTAPRVEYASNEDCKAIWNIEAIAMQETKAAARKHIHE
jgi:para-nitrobenzyl esterase